MKTLISHTHTHTHWRHNNIRSHLCLWPVSAWGWRHILVESLHEIYHENTFITHTHTQTAGIIVSDPISALDHYLPEAKGIYWSEGLHGMWYENTYVSHTQTYTQCNYIITVKLSRKYKIHTVFFIRDIYANLNLQTFLYSITTFLYWRHNNTRSHLCLWPVSARGQRHILINGLHGLFYEKCISHTDTHTLKAQ